MGKLRSRFGRPSVSTDPDVVGTLEPWQNELIKQVRPYTLTSPERLIATADAVEYVVRRGVSGALAECGVWRGGSVLAMILVLQHHGTNDRDIYLFDTFEGMTEPTDEDTSRFSEKALATWDRAVASGQRAWDGWFNSTTFSMSDIRSLLHNTGYPQERIHFVQGKVEDTIPDQAPEALALLRLDTDWYESTKHELDHLYPRLASGGVLLIDDYGHWDGCRRAVDEYFSQSSEPLLLHRTDYTGRAAVKL